MEKPKTQRKITRGILAAAVALLLVGAAAVVLLFTVRIGNRRYFRTQVIDARASVLTAAEYDAAAAALPGRVIRWSVPIGGERFDSFSDRICLSSLSEEELALLEYFPALKTIDARACDNYPALLAAQDRLDGVRVDWRIQSSDGALAPDLQELRPQKMDEAELRRTIPLLRELSFVDLRRSALSEEACAALEQDFAPLRFAYTVSVWGQTVENDTQELRLPPEASGSAEELSVALGRLRALRGLDLRETDLKPSELARLLPLCPTGQTQYEILLFGGRYPADTEELDLSGTPISDLSELEAAIPLLPALERLVMCDCGLPDEEMAALREKFAPLQVVWMLHFGVYSLRTDAQSFCANDLPQYGFVAPPMEDGTLDALKYCTDMIALDLGHTHVKDISFLAQMPHLKYLILVEGGFTDISVIGTLQELSYLELFLNRIDDVSPLTECRALRHLNIGYSTGFDPRPLMKMSWLERLWLPGDRIDSALAKEIAAALPDTRCYFASYEADGSTGGGWRGDRAYVEMRNAFGMHYQPVHATP